LFFAEDLLTRRMGCDAADAATRRETEIAVTHLIFKGEEDPED